MVVGDWGTLFHDGKNMLQVPLIGYTGTADRAHGAFGCVGLADICTHVHQCLVELTGMVFGQELTGQVSNASLSPALLERLVNGENPCYNSPNIGINGRDRLTKRDTQDRTGSVAPYAGQTDKFVPRIWNFSPESFRNLSGCRV
jgi:hypothetical protein